ncbi:hypothetical protein COLO4_04812 [Corchorus olitorius]|uniref:Uncharacterized protein n=1 Tax=Corchorus olitorius TaxID=93759 RepID=A0A1R3KSU4_9ROSI|nr:hypothetical protein COLO4_04812 [Corchorus olitorius]
MKRKTAAANASLSHTLADAYAEFSGFGACTASVSFAADAPAKVSASATANANKTPRQVSAPISENPAPAKAQPFKPPRGRCRQQSSRRTWVDAEHRVISSTEPTFRTSPRSRAKFMGKSASSLTSAPASSSSNHVAGKSSARDVENLGRRGAASNPKRKASFAAGT